MDNLNQLMSRQPDRFNVLLAEIRAAGTDNLSFFGNGYTHEGGLSLQQNPFEFAAAVVFLEEILGAGPRTREYLEIGSASGGACRFLCQKLGMCLAWVIDNHGHHRWPEQQANFDAMGSVVVFPYGSTETNDATLGEPFPMVQKWIGDSHSDEARRWLSAHLARGSRGTPDLSFIDGDHSGPGCWADFEMVYKLLKSRDTGSSHRLVMFHDTVACEGVKQSWQQACQSGMLTPLAEYIGPHERPLGIGIGRVG